MNPTIRLTPSGQFAIHVPSAYGGRGYTLTFPCTGTGAQAMRRLLQERNNATTPPKIGEPGSPTQAMIEEWLRSNEVVKVTPKALRAAVGKIDLSKIKL